MYKLHLQEISKKVYCIFIIGVPNDTYKYDINNLNLSEKKNTIRGFYYVENFMCKHGTGENRIFHLFKQAHIYLQ